MMRTNPCLRSPASCLGLAVAAAVILCGVAPSPAGAQVFGTWQTALTEPPDVFKLGGFLILGEPIGLVGQLRSGLSSKWDFGVQVGFPDFTDQTIFGIAGDTKVKLAEEEGGDFPVDLAADFAFGYQTADEASLVDLDLGLIGSKRYITDGGDILSPYAGLIFAIGHFDAENSDGDTELDVHVRPGLEWQYSPSVSILGELNLSSRDETIAISGGVMFQL